MRQNSLFPVFLERKKQYFVGIEHVCYHNCTAVLNTVLTKELTPPSLFSIKKLLVLGLPCETVLEIARNKEYQG